MSILDLKSPSPEAAAQHEPLPIRSTAGQDIATSAPPPWYRRGRVRALLSVVTLAMLAAAWLIHGWLLSGNVVSLSNLELATVKRGTFVQDISARGTVIAAVSPTLVATAAGTVHYRVHPGDRVERGQILAKLDSPELENEYQRELATLKSMNAALEQEQVRLREQLINSQQQANLAAVRMNAQLRDLQRAQAAWRVHVISERRYEAAYDAFSVARLDFENARDDAHLERQQILLSLRRRTLARDAQALRVAELKARAEALTVRSPVTGLVAQTLQPDQSYVAEDAPLVRVVDLKALAIRFQVAESLANGIVPGVPADITLGGQTVRGVVTDIAPAVVDGWVTGRARFKGPAPPGLRQNEQASVRIILGQKNDVLMMDRGAYIDPQTRFVYLVHGTEAFRVPVTFGAASISQIEILRGLTAGDTVVISNPRALHGARQVKITR